jgi:hypothetical protein
MGGSTTAQVVPNEVMLTIMRKFKIFFILVLASWCGEIYIFANSR